MTESNKPSEDILTLEDHEADVCDGSIINTPREYWPEGWTYVEGESSPPTTDLGRENVAWLNEQKGRNR